MKTNKTVEEIVVKLTRIAHPEDLGKPTSELENAIREALTQAREQGEHEATPEYKKTLDDTYQKGRADMAGEVREKLERMKIQEKGKIEMDFGFNGKTLIEVDSNRAVFYNQAIDDIIKNLTRE